MKNNFNDDINIREVVKKVSKELDIPEIMVLSAYKSFWSFIKTTIEELPLKEDLTDEEFEKLKVNFNIPSLGKLYTTNDKVKYLKNKFNKHINKNEYKTN